MKNNSYQCLSFSVPIALAIFSICKSSVLLSTIAIASALGLILVLPVCKGRENLWTFITITLISLPFNIKVLKSIFSSLYFTPFEDFFTAIVFLLGIFMMLSIENIVIGIIVRLIKPNQLEFDD